jgi:putative glycosyltransferase (TIGR04372 family)
LIIEQSWKTVAQPSRLVHIPLGYVRRTAAARFLVEQMLKTSARPTRLIHIPLGYARQTSRRIARMSIDVLERVDRRFGIRRIPGLVRAGDILIVQTSKAIGWPRRVLHAQRDQLVKTLTRVIDRLPSAVLQRIAPERCKARDYAVGVDLVQADRPEHAWRKFREVLCNTNNPIHFFAGAHCLAHGLGRLHEAVVQFANANESRWKRAVELGLADSDLRVLDHFWPANIGHTATLDYVVKLGIFEGKRPEQTILYAAPGSAVANPFYFDQWRPLINVIERPSDLAIGEEGVFALLYDFLGPRQPDGLTVYFWELAAEVQRRWHAEGRKPLLALPADVEERGWRALRGKGVPQGAWFVGLHVREAGAKPLHADLHRVLNANVMDYLPAIGEITRRGGWVIRIGDPSMVRLPAMANVIDYCHTDLRADWMDIFILARSRFFVGTSSGPAYVPPTYGVPSVLTNWWPPAQRPWHPTDIFIPKMHRGIGGRLLTLSETLSEPFGFSHSLPYLRARYRVRVEDNDPDLIRAAVVEMIEHLEGAPQDDSDVRGMRARSDDIYRSHRAFGLGRLAGDFLRENPAFVR